MIKIYRTVILYVYMDVTYYLSF